MRLELTRVGLLVELANHYTTKGAFYGNRWSRHLADFQESNSRQSNYKQVQVIWQ